MSDPQRVKGRRNPEIVKGAAFLCLLALATACTPLDDAMVAVFGRSMRDQSSFDPYENPLTAPEGAVPFAAGNLEARAGEVNLGQPEGLREAPPPFTQLDMVNEAPVVVSLQNPVPATEPSIQRGEELFVRFCAPCHGPNGDGVTGYIIPAGYPPYPLMTDRVKGFTDGYLYGMIRVGRGLMPAYGHRIGHFDRWNVVNYLRVLQGAVPALAVEPPETADDSNHTTTDQTEGASSREDGAAFH
ncbi:MAG: c-type cytochrome [Gemmatimonadota bacterium]